jgi:glycosyltransferase involved in cell wall biosynthesis
MLTVCGHLHGDFGWAHHARGLVLALADHLPIALVPWGEPPGGDDDGHRLQRLLAPRGADLASRPTLGVGPMHAMRGLLGTPRIGFTAWETTRIPRRDRRGLDGLDEVWIPSAWGREILVDNGVDPARVHVVPEGVDPAIFTPPAVAAPRARFRFLCVGKWEERKGTADLVRTFCAAFGPDEPVELYLHCWNPVRPDLDLAATVAALAPFPHAPVIVGRPLSRAALVALYQSSHAFVLPTRGEGWGLPILEAMACGLPVIVTDHGGHRAFTSAATAYLVRVGAMVDVADPIAFHGADFGQWAQPDLDHLRHLLRHVARHPAEAAAIGAAARADACARWTWRHAAAIARDRLAGLGISS